jgi:hypothetical protein
VYKIIAEIQPASLFGLPEENKIVWPAGELIVKILKDSSSNILFKISKYRDYTEAILFDFTSDEFSFKIDDNYIIFYTNSISSQEALDFCQRILNILIRLLQFKVSKFFKYKIFEIYYHNQLIPLPATGRVEGGNFTLYSLKELREAIDFSKKYLKLNDSKALRFLDYFDRAIFLENLYSKNSEKHLNERFYYFLLPEIFLNFYKSITTIIGDPSIDKDYQSRYKALGFNAEYFNNSLELLRKIRNDKDITHYTLKDNVEIYEEINKTMPQIKKVASEVFEKYLNKLDSTQT